MNKALSTVGLLLVLFCSSVAAEQPKTLNEAIIQSVETKKPIILIFSTDWCYYCKKFEADKKNKKFDKLFKDYIVFKINPDKDRKLFDIYRLSSFPTFVVVKSDLKLLEKRDNIIIGYKGPDWFIKQVKLAAMKIKEKK